VKAGAILGAVNAVQQGQRGALMPWAAVCLGIGVGIYFALPVEPGVVGYTLTAVLFAFGVTLALWRREVLGPFGIGLALVAMGVAVSGWRAHQVAGPVMEFRYYGPIEGRVVGIDRSASDAIRLTLDQVRLDDVRNVPRRVRVSLHGDQGHLDPVPGAIVMMTGHLSPRSGCFRCGCGCRAQCRRRSRDSRVRLRRRC
jgi:competence protein ComEC